MDTHQIQPIGVVNIQPELGRNFRKGFSQVHGSFRGNPSLDIDNELRRQEVSRLGVGFRRYPLTSSLLSNKIIVGNHQRE